VAQDLVLAAEWCENAAAGGCVESCHQLGEMYYYDKGVEQDFERAVAEYRRAADEEEGEEGGHAWGPAQYSLGYCYANGLGVEKDDVQARAWYTKEALQGESDAFYYLGVMCLEGEGGEKDLECAERMFRQAARKGSSPAQNYLGTMYNAGQGVVQDDSRAVAWFIKSADNGTSSGQANLARCYLSGTGVERDVFEAGRLYRLAAL
jgi:TPR repeat protein